MSWFGRCGRVRGPRGATVLLRIDDVGGERGRCTVMWLDMGKAGSEGNGRGRCSTTWSDTGDAGGEDGRDAAGGCRGDGWLGSEGMNVGAAVSE
jgi:hypothetical protein